jgi:hypothetical protein
MEMKLFTPSSQTTTTSAFAHRIESALRVTNARAIGDYQQREVVGWWKSGSEPLSHRKGALTALDRDPFEFGHLLHRVTPLSTVGQ